MGSFFKVARLSEIGPGQAKCVAVNEREIALFNVVGSFYAIDNTCTHVGGPLSEGELDGARVTCPWHGAVFDVSTGAVLGPPAAENVAKYNTRLTGEDVEVEI